MAHAIKGNKCAQRAGFNGSFHALQGFFGFVRAWCDAEATRQPSDENHDPIVAKLARFFFQLAKA